MSPIEQRILVNRAGREQAGIMLKCLYKSLDAARKSENIMLIAQRESDVELYIDLLLALDSVYGELQNQLATAPIIVKEVSEPALAVCALAYLRANHPEIVAAWEGV